MHYPSITLVIHVSDFSTLDRQMRSIASQTVLPSELICVHTSNDAAGSSEVSFSSSPLVSVLHIHLPETALKGAAFNAGLRAAQSEWVCFWESTDVFYNETALEYALAKVRRDGCDLLIADYLLYTHTCSPDSATGLSSIAHILTEASCLSWRQFPDCIAMTTLGNKFFLQDFLQRNNLFFDENISHPEYVFHAACCLSASFSMTDRCVCRHGAGRALAAASAASCEQEVCSLARMAEVALAQDFAECHEAFYGYLAWAALVSAVKIVASGMSAAQRKGVLQRWADLLRFAPAESIAFDERSAREYLAALHEQHVNIAESFFPAAVGNFIGIPLYGIRFDRQAVQRRTRLPVRLQAAYASLDPSCIPQESKPTQPVELSLLPKAKLLVEWGNAYVEVLDPLTNTRTPATTVASGVQVSDDVRRSFPTFFSTSQALDVSARCKVLTLCTTTHGGAGEGSLRRVRALRSLGIDARLVGIHSRHTDEYVGRVIPSLQGVNPFQHNQLWWQLCQTIALSKRASFKGHEFFPNAFSAVDFRQLRPLVEWADIVHLHWIDGMLDFEHIAKEVGSKPVVWTLSAMNPFTGGCHYSEGCRNYVSRCENCPQFVGEDARLPHEFWQIKERALQEMNICAISPSPGTAFLARNSWLFRNIPVHYIPNAYPVDRLVPLDRQVARDYLHLPQDKTILVFGATSQANPRKGHAILQEALHILKQQHPEACHNLLVVTFGLGRLETVFETRNLGFIPQTYLPMMFSAGNVMMIPSLEDNGPMTVGESLLCGTRVVAFSSLSLLSVLGKHEDTVYIADAFDPGDFARGIAWALTQPDDINARLRIRHLAEQESSPMLAARRHAQLYASLLKRSVGDDPAPEAASSVPEFVSDDQHIAFSHIFIDGMPYPSSLDSEMVQRHWVQRRDGRDKTAALFQANVDYNDFTYARRSHMEQLISGYLINSDSTEVNMDYCDLKAYQDGICAAFIDQMFPAGDAKILEIGGGYSRILAHFTFHNLHECWNLDKFEGVGNGPSIVPINTRYKVIPQYIGEFCKELPENYFDFVFSTSVLEHIPDDEKVFAAIYEDIDRLLKPGGYSLHLLDFGLKPGSSTTFHGIVSYLFNRAPVLHSFVEPQEFPHAADIFCMSRYRYDWRWRKVLQTSYADFGKPSSVNIFWKKSSGQGRI